MSAQRQHSNARPTGPLRRSSLVAALLLSVGLAACTALQPPTAAPTAENAAPPMPYEAALDAGTYRVTEFAVPFEITVPDGWEIKDNWLLIKGSDSLGDVFLNFLRPSHVPTDACRWSGTLADVGPSVEGFADALAAQASTTTTTSTDVTIGGYRGVEFGLSVDGDVDVAVCPQGHICIHSESRGHCTRYYQDVNRRETYRVLDLNGDRAVISVGEDAGVSAELVAEARAVFDSIEFQTSE